MFAATVLMVGCKSGKVSQKSIFEELTDDEVASAVKADSAFQSTYNMVCHFNDAIFHSPEGVPGPLTDEQIALYGQITYDRFLQFNKYLADTAVWNPQIRVWDQEWSRDGHRYDAQVDSIVDSYREVTTPIFEAIHHDTTLSRATRDSLLLTVAPRSVIDYMHRTHHHANEDEIDLFRGIIIREMIDSTYVDRHQYIDMRMDEQLMQQDSLCADFIKVMRPHEEKTAVRPLK